MRKYWESGHAAWGDGILTMPTEMTSILTGCESIDRNNKYWQDVKVSTDMKSIDRMWKYWPEWQVLTVSQEGANNNVFKTWKQPNLLPVDGKVEPIGEVDQWGSWHSSGVVTWVALWKDPPAPLCDPKCRPHPPITPENDWSCGVQ